MRTKAVLVYDGDCAFCTRSARWAADRLAAGDADVEPYQQLDLPALGLTEAEADAAAWWVDREGRRYRGHRAVAAALRAIGGLWGVVGLVISVPPVSWLSAATYAWVARNRHRMPGGSDACQLD
ncbi:MAG: thiol-disulfide oxidoreductase DCC family protein [Acidimicrobiales bacterium]